MFDTEDSMNLAIQDSNNKFTDCTFVIGQEHMKDGEDKKAIDYVDNGTNAIRCTVMYKFTLINNDPSTMIYEIHSGPNNTILGRTVTGDVDSSKWTVEGKYRLSDMFTCSVPLETLTIPQNSVLFIDAVEDVTFTNFKNIYNTNLRLAKTGTDSNVVIKITGKIPAGNPMLSHNIKNLDTETALKVELDLESQIIQANTTLTIKGSSETVVWINNITVPKSVQFTCLGNSGIPTTLFRIKKITIGATVICDIKYQGSDTIFGFEYQSTAQGLGPKEGGGYEAKEMTAESIINRDPQLLFSTVANKDMIVANEYYGGVVQIKSQ